MVENFPPLCYNGGMEPFTLIRSRRKTLSLSVTREGEVVVCAPLSMSRERIELFVQRHEGWLQRRLSQVRKAPALSLRDGEALTLFGTGYVLRTGRARIGGGELFLPEKGREEALARLLKRFALGVMERVTSRIAARYGFSYAAVRISSARGRWGSCNRQGVIAYTFRIAFLPPRLTEYVAVHELAHTVVFDHSAAFWEIVDEILPERRTLRRELRESKVMNWL